MKIHGVLLICLKMYSINVSKRNNPCGAFCRMFGIVKYATASLVEVLVCHNFYLSKLLSVDFILVHLATSLVGSMFISSQHITSFSFGSCIFR